MNRIRVVAASELPTEIDSCIRASEVEGFRFVRRLRDDWLAGENRFSTVGEAFFVARDGEALAGFAGLNHDPFARNPRIARLRRLYVVESFRRQGVATALVDAIVGAAGAHFRILRLLTSSAEADLFFRAYGFSATSEESEATHQLFLAR
jgi:GNAT superfamily N-acetyltransferase